MNKVVRLPNGNFITRKVVESDPRELAKAKPEEIWTMFDGRSNSGKTAYTREILIRDMEVTHLINALRLQVQQAYSKMRVLGLLQDFPELGASVDEYNRNLEKIMVEIPERATTIIAFARKTMPHFCAMQDELDIRLGRKQRAPEPVPEHTARKFDFT